MHWCSSSLLVSLVLIQLRYSLEYAISTQGWKFGGRSQSMWRTLSQAQDRLTTVPDFARAIDLSPQQDRSLLKLIMQEGDVVDPLPQVTDGVFLQWKVYDETGKLLHDTDCLPLKGFEFSLQFAQSEVNFAWEKAVRSMRRGERAIVYTAAHHAFGSAGAPPHIPPNTPLIIYFALKDILRSSSLSVKHSTSLLQPGEDVRESWTTRLREGYDPSPTEADRQMAKEITGSAMSSTIVSRPSSNLLEVKAEMERPIAAPTSTSDPLITVDSTTNRGGKHSNLEHSDNRVEVVHKSDNVGNPHSEKVMVDQKRRRYFDPSKHMLDPNRQLSGNSFGHRWHETVDSIEIDVRVPNMVDKRQFDIEIEADQIRVSLSKALLFDGLLAGKVRKSSANWALHHDDDKVSYVQFHLEKAHGHTEIWASALSKEGIALVQHLTEFA